MALAPPAVTRPFQFYSARTWALAVIYGVTSHIAEWIVRPGPIIIIICFYGALYGRFGCRRRAASQT